MTVLLWIFGICVFWMAIIAVIEKQKQIKKAYEAESQECTKQNANKWHKMEDVPSDERYVLLRLKDWKHPIIGFFQKGKYIPHHITDERYPFVVTEWHEIP